MSEISNHQEEKGQCAGLAVALSRSLASRRMGGGGGGDGDSDDDLDLSEDDWSEDGEKVCYSFFDVDETGETMEKRITKLMEKVVTARSSLPTATALDVKSIFTAQKEVRWFIITLFHEVIFVAFRMDHG